MRNLNRLISIIRVYQLMKTKKSFLIYTAFLLILSILFACTLKKPEAPEWDVTITIPLVNKDYFINELEDDKYFFVENNVMHFGIGDTLEPEKIGDYLYIDGREQSFTFPLQGGKVESPGVRQATYFLYEFLPDKVKAQQNIGKIEQFDYGGYGDSKENIIYKLAPYDKIKWAIVDTGFAIITLQNKTDIAFGSPIILSVFKHDSDTLCFFYVVNDTIFPGKTKKGIVKLNGKKIYREMDLYISGHSISTVANSIKIDEMTTFLVDVEIGDLKVKDTDAFMYKQNINETGAISIKDTTGELRIKSVIIDSCIANIYVENPLPQDGYVDIVFDELKDENDSTYHFHMPIAYNSTNDKSIDISNFKIYSDQDEIDSLHFTFTFNLDSTKKQVKIPKDDSISMTIDIGKMKFRNFEGKIINKEMRIERTEDIVDINYPENLEHNFGIIDSLAILNLYVENNIEVGGYFSMIITGINQNTEETNTIKVDEEYIQANEETSSEISGSIVSDFIEILPTMIIKDSTKMTINSEGQIVNVNKDDYVLVAYNFITPFKFKLKSDTVRIEPVQHIEINPDNAEKIRKNVKKGELILNVENSFPFDANINLYFSTIEDSVFSQPTFVIDSLYIKPAPVDENGLSAGITDNDLIIDLDKNQVDIFSHPDVYLGLEFIIEGTEEEIIAIKPDDHISITGRSVINVYMH